MVAAFFLLLLLLVLNGRLSRCPSPLFSLNTSQSHFLSPAAPLPTSPPSLFPLLPLFFSLFLSRTVYESYTFFLPHNLLIHFWTLLLPCSSSFLHLSFLRRFTSGLVLLCNRKTLILNVLLTVLFTLSSSKRKETSKTRADKRFIQQELLCDWCSKRCDVNQDDDDDDGMEIVG